MVSMAMMAKRGWYVPAALTLCAFIMLLPAADCRSQPSEMSVTLNKEFRISLDSNPSTGYRWEPSFDKAFLRLKRDHFKRPAKVFPGAGGTQVFVFLPIKPGQTDIHFVYKRSWETTIAREKTFQIQIR